MSRANRLTWPSRPTLKRTKILQEADLPLVSLEFANDPEYWNGRVKETMIPAGGLDPFVSSGSGDSGGPLLSYNPSLERWEQNGISSWGAGCNKPENPISVFTQVSAQLDWINRFVLSDFLSWSVRHGVTDLMEGDGDPYSTLFENLFGMNPTEPDKPAWLDLKFE